MTRGSVMSVGADVPALDAVAGPGAADWSTGRSTAAPPRSWADHAPPLPTIIADGNNRIVPARSALGEDPLDDLCGVLRRVDRVLDGRIEVAQLDDLERVVALPE